MGAGVRLPDLRLTYWIPKGSLVGGHDHPRLGLALSRLLSVAPRLDKEGVAYVGLNVYVTNDSYENGQHVAIPDFNPETDFQAHLAGSSNVVEFSIPLHEYLPVACQFLDDLLARGYTYENATGVEVRDYGAVDRLLAYASNETLGALVIPDEGVFTREFLCDMAKPFHCLNLGEWPVTDDSLYKQE